MVGERKGGFRGFWGLGSVLTETDWATSALRALPTGGSFWVTMADSSASDGIFRSSSMIDERKGERNGR
ncbi:hypothetical protein TorRG33x02_014860 [Trema orientale]|uniref:Uncharacterized protein n=1 Tax=Trema orientale TaxID=63057 RepID=A0A2P5FXH8_TREOI|nr:hypothetical protein TorRG33x02_014860 [Trema orientale]